MALMETESYKIAVIKSWISEICISRTISSSLALQESQARSSATNAQRFQFHLEDYC